jgi:hypothetical protein
VELRAPELETTCKPAERGLFLKGSSVLEMEHLNLEKVVVDGENASVKVIREAQSPILPLLTDEGDTRSTLESCIYLPGPDEG